MTDRNAEALCLTEDSDWEGIAKRAGGRLENRAAPGGDPETFLVIPPEPDGEPLTHFFHCWRFPRHHRCAVALIERQGEENDRLVYRVGALERQLRDTATS